MNNELFERELQNTSINGVSLADYIKENYVPKKSGKWINKDRYYHDTITAECSYCHREVEIPTCMEELMYDFCPMCGAKMESEEKINDTNK